MEKIEIPVSEKYTLTIDEAVAYFNIGIKRIRRIINENQDRLTILCGRKRLIIRHKFEEFLDEAGTI